MPVPQAKWIRGSPATVYPRSRMRSSQTVTGVTLTFAYDNLDNVTSISRNAVALVLYAYAGTLWTSRTVELGGAWAAAVESTVNRNGLARRVYGITHTGTRGASTAFTEALTYTRDRVCRGTGVG